ncbi:RagB/SusD family nutrient uptake outer membrane protein [Mangrovibacterium diazotrophicum]|uniref:Putative outer membrane starch-binding protein n=1 Tax=Mangrovibacterium diazotrophicum TaxID=1261403 RepID=A0A419W892_9BACT|nr:RagB/SusD family nutrient uptake outer membrane protein [Mangrovibacterium diazotrophicum]RKD91650.1 putative outer membrane starch-binding protein [Mangrovibacterium diazotrophicum]
MKILNRIITIFIVSAVLFGCSEDLLDKTPKDALSPSTFFQDETQTMMALVGVYNAIQPNATPAHFYQFEFMADNGYCQAAWQGSNEVGSWSTTSTSWAPYAKWTLDYSIISRANEFMQNLETAPVSDEVRSQMMGEAKFLRAYAYSDLITYFGDVPLITTVQTLEDAYVSRDPKSDVYNQIIADFDDAIAALPTTVSEVGRATKGAALAYKAKILLFNEDWSEAASAAKQVIDLGVYDFYPDYVGLFEEANENNEEVIFDIQYTTSQTQPWPAEPFVLGTWQTSNITADMINSYYMTNGLPITDAASGYDDQDPYTNRDPRLDATVVLPGTMYGDATFIPASYAEYPCGAKPRKYAEYGVTDVNISTLNTILMRYADVCLMRAEALIESGSTDQEIYDLIDDVRARVGMPSVESVEGTGLSQDELREIVRHERRVEFCMEGTRYGDMLRWKDESLVHDVYGYDKSKLSDPTDPTKWVFSQIRIDVRTFNASKGWLWPVPQADIDINENLLPQNPGY